MKIIYVSKFYKVARLTAEELTPFGTSGKYAVIDTFFDEKPLTKKVCVICVSPFEAVAWTAAHE